MGAKSRVQVLADLGVTCFAKGDTTRCIEFFDQALSLLSQEEPDSLYVTVVVNLGVAHMVSGDGPKALEFLQLALAAQEQTLGAYNLELVGTLQNLTVVCSKMGDSAKAATYMQRAGEIEAHAAAKAQGAVINDLDKSDVCLRCTHCNSGLVGYKCASDCDSVSQIVDVFQEQKTEADVAQPCALEVAASGLAAVGLNAACSVNGIADCGEFEGSLGSRSVPELERLPLADLVNKDIARARGVDPTRKEDFLSDDEFLSALGMDKDSFCKLAKWKRDILKKKAGLF